MEYYTYAYFREDKTPYYIGKGKGSRAYRKRKDGINPPKDYSKIVFLKQNLTEEEAFKHEIYMIAVLGRKDLGTGILRNKTNGGEGVSGAITTEETKRKQSQVKTGKNNPNYGKLHTLETRNKISEAQKGEHHHRYGKSLTEEHKRKLSEALKGQNNPNYKKYGEKHHVYNTKWWNDGYGNCKRSKECPGNGWALGRITKSVRSSPDRLGRGG